MDSDADKDIVEKKVEFSARKFMVFCYSGTYCLLIVGLLVAMLKKIIEPTVFLGALVGFAALAGQISDWYFKREDRITNGGQK